VAESSVVADNSAVDESGFVLFLPAKMKGHEMGDKTPKGSAAESMGVGLVDLWADNHLSCCEVWSDAETRCTTARDGNVIPQERWCFSGV
jgi:hypothetical protein